MENLILESSGGIFKIFGLGFMAGGLFSFAVMLVSDWITDREEKKKRKLRTLPAPEKSI